MYNGWASDAKKGPKQYHKSNLVMIGILIISILSSITLTILIRLIDGKKKSDSGVMQTGELDGAAIRERERG